MSEKISARRVIVCVEGVADAVDKKAKKRNTSNITRLSAIIKSGTCTDQRGRTVQQTVKFYRVAGPSALANVFSSKSSSPFDQQVQDIAFDICQTLQDPQDEIFLFGSAHGANSIRAVAGVLHHMGVPRSDTLSEFPQLFQRANDLYKARQTDDSIVGGSALQFLRARTQGLPNICFVGALECPKSSSGRSSYDMAIVPSIRHFRHALALNETRASSAPDFLVSPAAADLDGRSFIQAWFMGGHQEIVGGTTQDGLSLYPLQWLLVESMLQGLVVSSDVNIDGVRITENPLSLAFPQFAGQIPDLHIDESFRWQIDYTNRIQVTMFDLQSQHSPAKTAGDPSHEIAFENATSLHTSPRKIFTSDGLNGYDKVNSAGTIIHPSVFSVLDRTPILFEQARFKPYKARLADFEVNCMRLSADGSAPWLQGSQLLDSNVKAFRILVCGKTGVGKSTLINKVFGVEMTEESDTYKQGEHDINTAFESPNHPGLLIHDSRGWQAGSDHELDLIAQFLRHRAFQKDPAEALHVIWFCVDCDVSRIESADKRTFETIAQFSNHVPVIVVGTKKDKLVAIRKMQLLEEYMEKSDDYKESNRLANIEADRLANEQFVALRDQLAEIKSYKADGFVLISKNDDKGVKELITKTLDMITDERVRIFAVAAQVVDVEHKIDSAITECMRLGTHAIRTAMVPLPFSGMIGTPTVSRILCEHVLQCFGFPKAMPEAVEDIMSRIVMGNLKQFMTVTMSQFMVIGGVAIGVGVATMGIGTILGIAGSFFAAAPTARMLLKCACDMILILERSFRYGGKYVSVRQIEDAAKQYITIRTTSFGGKDRRLQEVVHEQVDRLIPLKSVKVGFQFKKLRGGFEQIVQKNRFDRPPGYEEIEHEQDQDQDQNPFADKMAELDATDSVPVELAGNSTAPVELSATPMPMIAELPDNSRPLPSVPELDGGDIPPTNISTLPSRTQSRPSELSSMSRTTSPSTGVRSLSTWTSMSGGSSGGMSEINTVPTITQGKLERGQSESSTSTSSSFFKKSWKGLKIKKTKSGQQ